MPEQLDLYGESLKDCRALLDTVSSTDSELKLPVTSNRAEAMKGVIQRKGSFITRLEVRLSFFEKSVSHKSFPVSFAQGQHIELEQITRCRDHVIAAIDILEKKCSDLPQAADTDYYQSLLTQLLAECGQAKECILKPTDCQTFPESSIDHSVLVPSLPEHVVLSSHCKDGAIVIEARFLLRRHSNSNPLKALTNKIATALIVDSASFSTSVETCTYHGLQFSIVQTLRVAVQDPFLLTCLAKLTALEILLVRTKRKFDTLQTVMVEYLGLPSSSSSDGNTRQSGH